MVKSIIIMALRKLPLDIQSLFHASAQIRTYKSAVEELVFNALDADSSSIAIRVNIQENYIQVVDNGHGVARNDFSILGQRYTTSKNDKSTSKSSMKYGHSGQSLANLVEVSQNVRITSRCRNNEETWTKSYFNGKEEAYTFTASRPSVGTTVEIKGFLYNLSIQKKAVKPLQELQNIKQFLEQISLVHCNTSISLRDNFQNEVIFKIHKNRKIIQTLESVLSIETSKIREFQVEKNKYRVTGFIQNDNEESKGYHWIFINERFIENSNLHKMVNDNLAKGVSIKNNIKTKVQSASDISKQAKCLKISEHSSYAPYTIRKTTLAGIGTGLLCIQKIPNCNHGDEKYILSNKIPDYFMFIQCPPNDYDIIHNARQSILEFKQNYQINALLEKLVKFYKGDIQVLNVTTTTEPIIAPETSNAKEGDTRNKVKKIIQRILGTQQRKINGSAVHNGVKGKMIRRKAKTRGIPPTSSKLKLGHVNSQLKEGDIHLHSLEDAVKVQNQPPTNNSMENNEAEAILRAPVDKQETNKKISVTNRLKNGKQLLISRNIPKNKHIVENPVLSYFEKETDEVQKRCHLLAKKVDHLLGIQKKRKCKIFTNEKVHYSNIVKDNKSISIRKKIHEIIMHEYLPRIRKHKTIDNEILDDIKKSDDLIHPFTNMVIDQNNFQTEIISPQIDRPQVNPHTVENTGSFDSKIPGPTYESHGYLKETQIGKPKYNIMENHRRHQFISKTSRDNFASTKTQGNIAAKINFVKKQEINKRRRKINAKVSTDVIKSSYSIHFTETNSQINDTEEKELNEIKSLNQKAALNDSIGLISLSDKPKFGNTYTVAEKLGTLRSSHVDTPTGTLDMPDNAEPNCDVISNINLCSHQALNISKTQKEVCTCTVERFDNNVIFISNTPNSDSASNDIEPLTVCEAVICSHVDHDREEFTFIFDSINNIIDQNISNNMQVPETPITHCKYRTKENDNRFNVNLQTMADNCNHGGNFELNNFNFKNRRRYIPKGLSPIFENCTMKTISNYEFDKEYFEKTVYDKFAENVRIHSEIFEPKIQNVTEAVTKDIQRVDNKFNKGNASLTFNGESVKHATVLGQVDSKFIATIMKAHSGGADNDCLVLFDQHAVHERIRLEQNMSEYITSGQWKSVFLDQVSLSLAKGEMLYLHNFRDKFQKLGLQWSSASDTQIMVTAIPEAILGKHPRQVDVVLKAVKNLIKEEICIIKEQGGCSSLYPKSIMDMVFSEACRYAVMFGDRLSGRECESLVEALSLCGTPFQCAHGRPAMAVLVEVARETRPYKVNFTKVEQFRSKQLRLINRN